MKFTSERAIILGPLLAARDIAVNNSPILVLSTVRMNLVGNSLQITATDQDIEYTNTVTVQGGADGKILVNAQRIADIVKSFADGSQVEIALDDKAEDGIIVRSGRSRFRLNATAPEAFPMSKVLDDANEFALSQNEYTKGFQSTLPFACQDQTKYTLCGVNIRPDQELVFESTNCHTLSQVRMTAPIGSNALPGFGLIIPTQSIHKLLKMASGDMLVRFTDSLISFSCGSMTFVSKMVDGAYPDLDRVIQIDTSITVLVKAVDVKSSVNRIALVGGDESSKNKSATLKLELSKSNMVISGSSSGDEGVEDIEAVSDGEITVGFEPRYLALAVNTCNCDEVKILIKDKNSPVIFRPADDNGITIVVMPKMVA